MTALVPPFTRETAIAKVRMALDGWNSRDPHRVSLAYTEDSCWRNRAEFIDGPRRLASTLVVEFSGRSAVQGCGVVEVAIGPGRLRWSCQTSP
jgi:nuclear transport factor 2 (NTF2) superfamily protein